MNKTSRFLNWYLKLLRDKLSLYSLATKKQPYKFLSRWCNHPETVPTPSKGFVECLSCYKWFKPSTKRKGDDKHEQKIRLH